MAEFRSHVRSIASRAGIRALASAGGVIAYRAAAGGLPIALGLFITYRWGLLELAPFTVANAIIAVAMVVVDWGGTRAMPRNLARVAPQHAVELIGSANAFRLLLTAGLVSGVALAALTGWLGRDVLIYLAILSPLCLIAVATGNALSERIVSGKTNVIGGAVLAGLVVFAILAAAATGAGLGPRWLVAAYVAAKTVEAAMLLVGRAWVIAVRGDSVWSTAAAMWPFSAQMIMGVLYSRLAVFTLENLTSRTELGVFSVAVALQSALLLIPGSLALVHFPELTRRLQERSSGVRTVLMRYALVSAAGVTAGLLAVALLLQPLGRILNVPPVYRAFLVVFAGLAYLSIFSTIAGFLLQAYGQERLAARLSLLTLAAALGYQFVTVRQWGLDGIVIGVAASELTSIAVFGTAVRSSRRRAAFADGAAGPARADRI
jgi:O-antigen/teichoic acid export membrane protein